MTMIDPQVISFCGISAILTMTPGADTMMILRSVLKRGQRAGVLTMAGICSGLFFHATLSALGLSLILVRSAIAFEMVKFLGACYLIYLGGHSLLSIKRGSPNGLSSLSDGVTPERDAGVRKSFFEGLLTNLLNPKVAIFYLAFLPQFISPGDWVFGKSVLLASIHFSEGVIWYSLLIVSLGRMRKLLVRRGTRQVLEGVSGTILIAFGLRLAVEHR